MHFLQRNLNVTYFLKDLHWKCKSLWNGLLMLAGAFGLKPHRKVKEVKDRKDMSNGMLT